MDADCIGLPVPHHETVGQYGHSLGDVAFWEPYVSCACARHGIDLPGLRSGEIGTYPTFIVDETYVVKLFGPLFGGGRAYAVENTLYSALRPAPGLPVPERVASGHLFGEDADWHWPYVISRMLPGAPLAALSGSLQQSDRLAVARALADVLRRIHATPLDGSGFLVPTWDAFGEYVSFLASTCVDRHREWRFLPPNLIEQIPDYVMPVTALVANAGAPVLAHADVTEDHVLLLSRDGGLATPHAIAAGDWQITGLIDMGDARVGDRLFELVPLYLSAFRGDKQLLGAFLAAYEEMRVPDLVHRAMTYTLLFEFDVLAELDRDAVGGAPSLEAMASALWNTERPPL